MVPTNPTCFQTHQQKHNFRTTQFNITSIQQKPIKIYLRNPPNRKFQQIPIKITPNIQFNSYEKFPKKEINNQKLACGIAKNSELQLQIRGIEKKRWVFVGLLQAKQRHLNY